MTNEKSPHHRLQGRVRVPSVAIGGLSMALAAGLALLGPLERVNQIIALIVSRNGAEKFPNHLPAWSVWLVAAAFSFGLAYAILCTPTSWRRIVLWIASIIALSAWAPVLSLAAYAPEIGAPWIATVWSGVCALFYATNHHMPCDDSPPPSK